MDENSLIARVATDDAGVIDRIEHLPGPSVNDR
jgi:hypothetical protein